MGVGEVQGVALPVLVDRERLAARMAAHDVAAEVLPAVLVDEVAEEDDEVGRPLGEVAVGGVVPGLEVLAGRRRQAELRRIGAGRSDPSDRARPVAGAEAEERRAGHVDDDVHAVRLVGPRPRPRPHVTLDANDSSSASSHVTATSSASSADPSGLVRRVHSTADRSSGSPAHTPSANGLPSSVAVTEPV